MTARSPVKINTALSKEWITGILTGTKAETLLQEMVAAIRVVK